MSYIIRCSILLFSVLSFILSSCGGSSVTISIDEDISLSQTIEQAIELSPAFLCQDLKDLFSRLDDDVGEELASLLLDIEDERIIDEVAFSIAHLPVEVLEDKDFMSEILIENASYIYEADESLQYVDIFDVKDTDDDDFYSTLLYRVEEEGEMKEFELDPEIYYWYVVHPKIEDESPFYINPEKRNSRVDEPPDGRFWREFFWNHADENYPFLKDYLENEIVVWKGKSYNKDDNGAIGRLIEWLQQSMVFGAGSERPVQPVRIYNLHRGNCGEWADMTTAVARTALIPCRNVGARGNDHTWNEFYDRRWIQWEPVNTYVEHYYYYVDENGNYYFQNDAKDNNCDGTADFGEDTSDDDGDGFSEADGDCNDADEEIYPDAEEVEDAKDNDCDGIADDGIGSDDLDSDGWAIVDGDCNDTDATIYPTAEDPPPSNNRVYSVTAWRGDDYMWDVTGTYGTTFDLHVWVRDEDGDPIDGAVISLWGPILVYPEYSDYIWFVSGGTTDVDGFAGFVLGEANDYYGRVDSEVGSYPRQEGKVKSIVEWSEPGVTETWEVEIEGERYKHDFSIQTPDSFSDVRLEVSYDFETYYLHGKNPLFMAYNGQEYTFSLKKSGGEIKLFLLTPEEMEKYRNGTTFTALFHEDDAAKKETGIRLPEGEIFYLVFSNRDSLAISRSGTVTIEIFSGCNKDGEGCKDAGVSTYETIIPEGKDFILKIKVS